MMGFILGYSLGQMGGGNCPECVIALLAEPTPLWVVVVFWALVAMLVVPAIVFLGWAIFAKAPDGAPVCCKGAPTGTAAGELPPWFSSLPPR